MTRKTTREIVGNPLVAKPIRKKKTNVRFEPASVIPGVKHFIEGMPQYSRSYTQTRPSQLSQSFMSPQAREMSGGSARVKESRTGIKEDKSVADAMTQFNLRQAARSRITPIADPEAGKQERRRTAARKRMRGRLGTLLSNRETLA
jgi:hypothetical protein